ncbi:polymer-forming cytoskeletal protein [Sporomusa sp.]|jgi:cytoskeletal protein CcmA (bactofilin family)|uniref:bactofilin family protein n=1 Tax=Sporomusa sp. TaxID=2078658 RepID=UPI002CAE1459|nr:polymer-forming cytoskeletal protein [Sporomusa sp.]MDF2875203.1 Polymer-forming cytoskeletal [Sporomusa sp.]HWR06279.1 polymer-forming cytoskeletal protein [Sporomusa sp.]
MFGSKKQAISMSDQVGTIIGRDTSFKGCINSQGTIRIDGQHEGELITAGDIVVGESGRMQAQLKACNVIVAGMVTGNIEVSDKLELLPTAKVYGDIKVGTLTINEGAVFRGACQMLKELPSSEDAE